ncbi:MAG: diacylglycerol kinase family lipid kinase [Chloroflexi bacterium]|nr:diacylglycerol kinase family lipid kinase [Chloroflexota bacterium]
MNPKLIVNPMAARGQVGKRWPEIHEVLKQEGWPFEVVFTERRGHAMELARQALDSGFDLIVAVGGDGTLNEVVNGMLENGQAVDSEAALGVISSGTGSDFVRTVGIPRDVLAAARSLAHARTVRPLDVGEVTCTNDGRPLHRYFANVAGMGFDAEVVDQLERGGKRGGGTLPYLTTLITTIARYQNKDVSVHLDDQALQGRVNDVIVCNGKYFGGGMRVAPHATLEDGAFDVIILGDFSTVEILMNTPKIYNGTHLTLAKVSECRSSTVRVETNQPMLIEADGELIGQGPALFQILPGALKLRV